MRRLAEVKRPETREMFFPTPAGAGGDHNHGNTRLGNEGGGMDSKHNVAYQGDPNYIDLGFGGYASLKFFNQNAILTFIFIDF